MIANERETNTMIANEHDALHGSILRLSEKSPNSHGSRTSMSELDTL